MEFKHINFDLLERQGISIFLSRVRESDLVEVTQSLSLISKHIFVKTQCQWLQVQNLSSLWSGFHAMPIRSVS